MVDNRKGCASKEQGTMLPSESSMPKNVCRFHKMHRIRQNSLPTFPSSGQDIPDVPDDLFIQDIRQNVPPHRPCGTQDSSQMGKRDSSQMGRQDSSQMESDNTIPDGKQSTGPDHSFLFQTASRILHNRGFDPDVPVTRYFRKGGRSFSDSWPPSESPPDQPKILYRKRSKQFVIRLPSGELLDGKWIFYLPSFSCYVASFKVTRMTKIG